MKNYEKSILTLVMLFSLLSCKQDPYPAENGRVETPPDKIQRIVLKPLAMAVDSKLKFQENYEDTYPIRVSVQEPGVPIVKVENLPDGAIFNEETFELTWKPGFFDGNDSKDPTISEMSYPIIVDLRSSLDETTALRRPVELIVRNTPRKIDINGSGDLSVNEGQKLVYKLNLENEDFPKGPFKVTMTGMPPNTELVKIDENNYQIEYSPDFFYVNRKNSNSVTTKGKVVVANPSNNTANKTVKITVNDVRLDSKIVSPEKVVQGLDVSFQVIGYDLNKEVTPDLVMVTQKPEFGEFKFSEVTRNDENHSTVYNLTWNDIPPANNGKKFSFKFKACVLNSYGRMSNCAQTETKVEIVVRDRKAPIISRSKWPIGEMRYLGHKEQLKTRVRVEDGEDSRLDVKVEIFPKELRKYVKWENDSLKLKFDKAGTFQFNVVATSDYNVSSAESFLVEVFKENRNKILFFADSTRDPEVVFYRKSFKNVDMMNPAIQEISQRNISGRETLVIGTSSLMDKELQPKILKAINKIKNIVIASPLLNNLPEEFLNKLKNKYDLITIGRYNDLPGLPKLEDVQFAKNEKFTDSKEPVRLKLSASDESKNPMLFNGGLYESNKNCKAILGLSKDGITQPLPIGAVCDRDTGGKISLLGTEWADLKVSEADKDIPLSWFNTMINEQF